MIRIADLESLQTLVGERNQITRVGAIQYDDRSKPDKILLSDYTYEYMVTPELVRELLSFYPDLHKEHLTDTSYLLLRLESSLGYIRS